MKTVIIGNGISGITAARWIRKLSDHQIVVISSESKYFFSRTALMYVYMGHMKMEHIQPYENDFWEKNRIELVQDFVKTFDFEQKTLSLSSGNAIKYDKLVLALGSQSNKFGWPGQDLKGVGGLYSLQDLEHMERYSNTLNRAVVVGGGLIGIEMAEMFHSRHINVTMLVRESNYWNNVLPEEEASMISEHIRHHGIDLRLGVNLDSILANDNGEARAVTVKETGEEIDCGFVGLTAGVHPNVAQLKNSGLNINRGIVVDGQLRTNIDGVYAVGDCAELAAPKAGRRAVEAVWYTGRMMGEVAARNICGSSVEYDPGIWFNSAKFMDIEYQVYGEVSPQLSESHKALFWKDDGNKHSIRIVYEASSKSVVGFNLLGIRFRHEVCEKWLKDQSHVEEVLENLSMADFNPEFFKSYEYALVDIYNKQNGSSLKLKSKRSLNTVLNFLKS